MASNDTLIEVTFTIEIKKKQASGGSEGTAIALVLLFVAAFALNVIVVGTVSSSYLLKKVPFHLLVLSLGCAHLIETVFNMAVSIFFVTAQKWNLGQEFCFVSAAMWTLVPCVLSLQLMYVLVDRVVAVRHTTRYKQLVTPARQSLSIITVWIMATSVSIPIALGEIHSRPFVARYACCPSDVIQVTFNIIYPVVIYGFPFLVSLICGLYLGVVLVKDYLVSTGSHRQLTMNDKVLRQPLLWTELQLTRVALAAFVLYALLHVPSIVNVHVDQASSNHSFPVIVRRNNGTNGTEIRQEVVDSPARDTPFTWFRYVEAIFFPLLVLLLRHDIRSKAVVLIVFWKTHPTADMSPRPSAYLQKNGRSVKGTGSFDNSMKKKKRKGKKELAHYNTPVLFATSEGLYLRVTEETARRAQSGGFRFWLETGAPWSAEELEFVCHVCDVWDAYDDIEDLEQTSEDPEGVTAKDDDDHLQRTLSQAQVFNFRRSASERRFSAPSLHLGETEKINGDEDEPRATSSDEDSGVAEEDSDHGSSQPSSSERRKSVRFAEEVNEIPRSSIPSSAPTQTAIRRLSLPPLESFSDGRYRKNPLRVRPVGFNVGSGVGSRVRRKMGYYEKPAWNSNTRVENGWTDGRRQKRATRHKRQGSGSRVFPSS